MKSLNRLTLLVALVAGLATFPALRADDKPETEKPEKPETEKQEKQENEKDNRGGHSDLDKVRVPERFKDDAALQKLIDEAKAQREAFVAEQKELSKNLKGATSDEKEKLKEQLKANREKFLEDTKQLRADIRERVKELVTDLKAGNIKDGGTEGGGRGRGRRGGN